MTDDRSNSGVDLGVKPLGQLFVKGNIRHTLDSFDVKPEDKWLVVGKGPSFNSDLVRDLFAQGYRLCSINNAFDAVPDVFWDLCVYVDWPTAAKFKYPEAVDLFATASVQHRNILANEKTVSALLIQMAAMLPIIDSLSSFDIMGSQTYPAHPDIYCVTSSSEAAFHLLCIKGATYFHFNGIDGGMNYHQAFSTESRGRHGSLDGQFQGISKLAHRYAVTVEGLAEQAYQRFNIPRSAN